MSRRYRLRAEAIGLASLALGAFACSASPAIGLSNRGSDAGPVEAGTDTLLGPRVGGTSGMAGDASTRKDAGAQPRNAPPRSDAGAPSSDAAVPIVFTSTPMDHSAGCPGSTCAIVDDVAVSSSDPSFANLGIGVAPAHDATWLTTSGTSESETFRIAQGTATRDTSLPASFADGELHLALSPSGEPSIAAAVAQGQGADGEGTVEFANHDGSAWTSPVLTTLVGTIVGAEYGIDGTPHVWVDGTRSGADVANPQHWHASQAQGGWWNVESARVVAMASGFPKFSLTTDGRPASLDIVGSSQLAAIVGGIQDTFGGMFTTAVSPVYALAAPHAVGPTAPGSGPLLAAAFQALDGIHVASLGGAGAGVVVANTAPPNLECTMEGPDNNACPGPCHETEVGVEYNFALARTADGVGWLAYVVTQYDEQVHYVMKTGYDPESDVTMVECEPVIDTNNNAHVLHLARIAFDGAPAVDVLSGIAVDEPTDNLFAILPSGSNVDARAFGTDLAIGIRTGGSTAGPVRVIRIDTTLFGRDM